MINPSLRHLVEDHLKPKWWQFRKQRYHVCHSYGTWVIYEVPTKCMLNTTPSGFHTPRRCARISLDSVIPICCTKCSRLSASDPAFFEKLDEFLARECNTEPEESEKAMLAPSSSMPGPSI